MLNTNEEIEIVIECECGKDKHSIRRTFKEYIERKKIIQKHLVLDILYYLSNNGKTMNIVRACHHNKQSKYMDLKKLFK